MRHYEAAGRTVCAPIPEAERAQIRQKLVGRLTSLADKHGFSFNRVFIRNQRTRWGSCSHQGNISLNARIARLPGELMDYVILHELTHTRQPNHRPAFWAELDKVIGDGVGDAKALAKRLGEYGLGMP
jgi:predicted metal-dependent hydrolase